MKTFFNDKNLNKSNRYYYNLSDSNRTFFYAIACSLLTSLVFSFAIIIFSGISGFELETLTKGNQIVGYLQVIIMPVVYFMLFYFYNKRNNVNPVASLGIKNPIDWKCMLITIAMAIVCIASFVPFINLVSKPFEIWGYEGQSYPFEMYNWWTLILGIVGYAIFPAFAEELVFRGMIQKGYEKKFTPFVAVFVSTLAFCLMHGSLQQTFYQLILGVILGVIYVLGKNIIYPMIFHILNNTFVLLIDYFQWPKYMDAEFFNYNTFWGITLPIIIAIVGAGIIVGLVFLMKKVTKKSNNKAEFIIEGENIIFEEDNKKYGIKSLFKAQNQHELMYFLMGFGVAIILWINNTIEGF